MHVSNLPQITEATNLPDSLVAVGTVETGLDASEGATKLDVYEGQGQFIVVPCGEVENADWFAFEPQTDGDVTGSDAVLEALAVYLAGAYYPVLSDLDRALQSKVTTTLTEMGYSL